MSGEGVSIYCSRVTLGFDHLTGKRRGHVAAYPQNKLARVEDPDWPDGNVDTAHIPVWCVPGHEGDFDERVAKWLRMSLSTAGVHASVLLDEKAARALIKDLQAWLELPKAKSRTEPA